MSDQITTEGSSIDGGASALTAGLAPTTLCWNCNTAYPMETRQCPGCCATNANKDLASAQEEMQDKRLIDHDWKWISDWYGDPDQTLTAIADLKASPISEEAMDILRAENEKLKTEVEEFAVLTSRLARQLKKAAPDNELPGKVADYLKRTGRHGSPLREVGSGETAVVTREMIGAAHDVMLAKGDFVLSAALLERIYLAMDQAAPPATTPFNTCPTCEELARTVMMDQTGAA